MSEINHYTEQNRRAWNEIAEIRSRTQPPATFFAQGGSTLDQRELEAAGDVRGKTLLHLQCATGEDTLSWAVAGAEATGVDISDKEIEIAQRKAVDARLPVRFVTADIYDLPVDLQNGTFDYVYTGKGILVWLPDLTRWAQVIATALKPGGSFILFEEHPLAMCLWPDGDRLLIGDNYFSRSRPNYSQGWRHFTGGEQAQAKKAEFSWPLGDIVTALAQAGLRIESLQEFPAEKSYRFTEEVKHLQWLPGHILLVASKS